MSVIEKKIWPKYFDLVESGKKKFDLRLADFSVKEGDTLIFREWDPHTKAYTGRKITTKINYLFKFGLNDFGQQDEIEKYGLYVIQF